MRYNAIVSGGNPRVFIRFPGFEGCKLWVPSGHDLRQPVVAALAEWLEGHLARGQLPPPQYRPQPLRIPGLYWLRVPVPPIVASRIQLRRARRYRGLTQAHLGALIGATQQLVALCESRAANPRLSTLASLAAALRSTLT